MWSEWRSDRGVTRGSSVPCAREGQEEGGRRREGYTPSACRAAQAEVDGQERFNLLSLSTSAFARSLARSLLRFVRSRSFVVSCGRRQRHRALRAPRTKIGNAAVFANERRPTIDLGPSRCPAKEFRGNEHGRDPRIPLPRIPCSCPCPIIREGVVSRRDAVSWRFVLRYRRNREREKETKKNINKKMSEPNSWGSSLDNEMASVASLDLKCRRKRRGGGSTWQKGAF